MKRALFIFRRDLRLQDNRGLIQALNTAEEVILAFIFTPEQIEHNAYKSDRSLQFMIESLEELNDEVVKNKGKLYLFYSEPEKIVEKCITELSVDGVFVNSDYTPYSLRRDKKILSVCSKYSISFRSVHDLLLHPVDETLKSDGKPYTIFTPFFRNASKLEVCPPELKLKHRYYTQPISFSEEERTLYDKILPKRLSQAAGGRKAGLKILENLEVFKGYAIERDFPERDQTTHLSPHLKFNTCSIREVYQAIVTKLGAHSELIRSLYWRDFFTSIGFHFPYVFEGAFKRKYDQLNWYSDSQTFDLWCQGKTGFPIVDAGMRELNQTGNMHNRVRMIVASFLIKDLHIDWRWGEKYFAQKLIDYDPALNNGNWQWSAGTGCDAQPYYRIFNPWLQAQKFDSECVYIKKWVPELRRFSSGEIHKWYLEKHYRQSKDYPSPIIDHAKEAAVALKIMQKSNS